MMMNQTYAPSGQGWALTPKNVAAFVLHWNTAREPRGSIGFGKREWDRRSQMLPLPLDVAPVPVPACFTFSHSLLVSSGLLFPRAAWAEHSSPLVFACPF